MIRKARRTMIGIDEDVDGWVEWAGKFRSDSQAAYLNQLARADRNRHIAESPETAERYRAYLTATGRDSELEMLDRMEERHSKRDSE